MFTRESILTMSRIVFDCLGEDGRPIPHGYTDITDERDRIPMRHGAPIPRV